MNIVDSSGWLEYFAATKNAANFAKPIEDIKNLLVPTMIIHEVFKKILAEKGEHAALQAVAYMKLGKIVDLDLEIALLAAKLGKELGLPMADSIILATAQKYGALLYTQDSDFIGIKGVNFFNKKL